MEISEDTRSAPPLPKEGVMIAIFSREVTTQIYALQFSNQFLFFIEIQKVKFDDYFIE